MPKSNEAPSVSYVHDAERHKARVLRIARKVEKYMDMSPWDIEHQFHDGFYEDHVQADEYGTTCATTVNRWEYRMARIQWFLTTVAMQSDEKLEEVMVHEFCHVLLGPMHSVIKAGDHCSKLEELATENVMRAIRSARNTR